VILNWVFKAAPLTQADEPWFARGSARLHATGM
jgi:hypothetical protein